MNALHYAVVVGIDVYPGLRNLRSARGDAEAFRDWLVDPAGGGVPAVNVKLVTTNDAFFNSPLDAVPTRELVDRALREVHQAVAPRIKAYPLEWDGTRLYFYLSGHGIAPSASEAAVLMANSSEDYLGASIACRLYLDMYREVKLFREVVILADCCREQKWEAPAQPPAFTRAAQHAGTVSDFLGFATQYGDVAYEPPAAAAPGDNRGYFTQALLEGLRGAAVDTATGEINGTSLARYARRRTEELTRDLACPQSPRLQLDAADLIVFKRAAPVPQYAVTIAFPVGFAGPVELLDKNLAPRGQFVANGAAWGVQLENGFYEVRPQGAADGSVFAGSGLFKVLGEARRVQL